MYGNYELNSSLGMFTACCDEMAASKYILADKKISDLLKCIVTSGELMSVMETCLKDFNYEVEFMKAKSPCTETGNNNRFCLTLPQDRKRLAAFVLCLLGEFDNKTRDLHKFLMDFFYVDGSMFESYNNFVLQVIKPFKRTVEILVNNLDGESERTEAGERAEKYFSAEPVEMNSKQVEELIVIIQELINKISSESALNLTEKQEMLSITDGLSNAVITRDARLIKILWIGFKNTFKDVKPAQKVIGKIEEKLKSFWII